MKQVLWILLAGLFSVPALNAQDALPSSKGLQLYTAGQYEAALKEFNADTSGVNRLFAAKCLFSLNRLVEASDRLQPILKHPAAGPEALYTLGLISFENRHFTAALDALHQVRSSPATADLKKTSEALYEEVLGFMTPAQRASAARHSRFAQVRADLVSSKGRRNGPAGFAASVALAIPKAAPADDLFPVSQGLFNGFALAIDQFNEESGDYKIFLRHIDTPEDMKPEDVLRNTLQEAPVDVVFGPLFSFQAAGMADVAEEFEVPMLAPLANSDTLNILNPFVFQLNPVWGARGRAMAHFAVNKLRKDSLAVVAEKGSLGEAEALAFAEEAQRLGATITYFYLRDLEKIKYEITPFLEVLSTDRKMVDSLRLIPTDAIFLPFSGQAAQALIQNAATDIENFNPKTIILGSEEWGQAELAPSLKKKLQIYYTQGFVEAPNTKTAANFRTAYKDRYGANASQWAFVGYDAGQFVSQSLLAVRNPARLRRYWIERGLHEGLVARINFLRSNVNRGVRIIKLEENRKIEIR